jgi:hypothetical protein
MYYQPRVMEMADSLVKTLEKRVNEGSIVHIYPFGDSKHERKSAMVLPLTLSLSHHMYDLYLLFDK